MTLQYVRQGWILSGGAHPPWNRFAPSPDNFCTSPEKWCTSPWESFNDRSKWKCDCCLGSTLPKKVFFCQIETVIAIHLCVKYPFNAMFWKKLCSNCNEGQNLMRHTYSHNSLIHWYICTLRHAFVTSLTLARSTVSLTFHGGHELDCCTSP
jgi:hypothetical protein